MKIGLKSIAICFAFANGYGMLKSCPDVKDAKWEALVIRQLKNLMKTRKDYLRTFQIQFKWTVHRTLQWMIQWTVN